MKTQGEIVFENFCHSNGIQCERIEEGPAPTPDYRILFDSHIVYGEIKQIDKDDSFDLTSSSRTVGSHIREKIKEARKQVKAGSNKGFPSILLVYNNIDRMQLFGTEDHDFITAMYGEMTVVLNKAEDRITDSFYGRNRSFAEDKSAYFSAVGLLSDFGGTIRVQIYENAFALNPIDFCKLPSCIELTRVKLE